MPKQPVAPPTNVLVLRTETVPVNDLTMFHLNPKVGDVDAIAESLKKNKQFRAIVVNIGTYTGRKNEILAGNHTWLGTKRNGDKDILAHFVDVDEEAATRINVADNRTAEKGTYDESILAELLATLPDAEGTGFSQDELNDLIAGIDLGDVDQQVDAMTEQVEREREMEDALRRKQTFDGADFGEEPDPAADPADMRPDINRPDPAPEDKLAKASDELKGGFQLKEDLDIPQSEFLGEWGIPALRRDRLATWDDLPEKLKAWAGSASRDEPDEDMWWLYNFGIDSTSGMKDVSKVIVSFYAYDDYFENWWWYPQRYVSKCLNSGIKLIVTPDFSMADLTFESRTLNLWNVLRQRWCGRYFQEAGMKVIPNVTWSGQDLPLLWDVILPTLPKNPPLLALQIQAVFDTKDDAAKREKEELETAAIYQRIIDTVQPDDLLLYYGSQGKDMWEKHVKFDGRIKWVESRMYALAEQAKKRTKKKTL